VGELRTRLNLNVSLSSTASSCPYLVVAAVAARHSEELRALDMELQGAVVPKEELQGVVIATEKQLQYAEVTEEVLAEEELVLAVELQAVTTRKDGGQDDGCGTLTHERKSKHSARVGVISVRKRRTGGGAISGSNLGKECRSTPRLKL
jgi:hypothetical protein